jgi:hypothetical protein
VSEDGAAFWNCSARACSASGMVQSLPLVVWSVVGPAPAYAIRAWGGCLLLAAADQRWHREELIRDGRTGSACSSPQRARFPATRTVRARRWMTAGAPTPGAVDWRRTAAVPLLSDPRARQQTAAFRPSLRRRFHCRDRPRTAVRITQRATVDHSQSRRSSFDIRAVCCAAT